MPFVHISIGAETLTVDQLRDLHAGTAKLMVEHFRKKADRTTVRIERSDPTEWTVGGKQVRVSAHVVATITSGNADIEKSRFTQAQISLMRHVLGNDLEDATYIVIQELSPGNWGDGSDRGISEQ